MNTKDVAEKLNGTEYPLHIGRNEVALLKAAGIVVVYGASDDLMEFQGAINDEIGCNNGGDALIDSAGVLCRDDGDEDDDVLERHFNRLKYALTVTANWDTEGYSWTYTTDIPHETFDIVEDGDKYCRGIVFSLRDIEQAILKAKRTEFEKWVLVQTYFGYDPNDATSLEAIDRDTEDGGYQDANVHGAWIAWQAAKK